MQLPGIADLCLRSGLDSNIPPRKVWGFFVQLRIDRWCWQGWRYLHFRPFFPNWILSLDILALRREDFSSTHHEVDLMRCLADLRFPSLTHPLFHC